VNGRPMLLGWCAAESIVSSEEADLTRRMGECGDCGYLVHKSPRGQEPCLQHAGQAWAAQPAQAATYAVRRGLD
jgi:hypothetical protein